LFLDIVKWAVGLLDIHDCQNTDLCNVKINAVQLFFFVACKGYLYRHDSIIIGLFLETVLWQETVIAFNRRALSHILQHREL